MTRAKEDVRVRGVWERIPAVSGGFGIERKAESCGGRRSVSSARSDCEVSFESFAGQHCLSPKRTVGEQLLDVRLPKAQQAPEQQSSL